jgi:predicted dehydrogenase
MLRLQTGKGLWISENGAYREESLEREMDPFVLQLTDLVDAINGIRPLECSGEYAATINEVLDAIYRSHETGEEIEIHTKQG